MHALHVHFTTLVAGAVVLDKCGVGNNMPCLRCWRQTLRQQKCSLAGTAGLLCHLTQAADVHSAVPEPCYLGPALMLHTLTMQPGQLAHLVFSKQPERLCQSKQHRHPAGRCRLSATLQTLCTTIESGSAGSPAQPVLQQPQAFAPQYNVPVHLNVSWVYCIWHDNLHLHSPESAANTLSSCCRSAAGSTKTA